MKRITIDAFIDQSDLLTEEFCDTYSALARTVDIDLPKNAARLVIQTHLIAETILNTFCPFCERHFYRNHSCPTCYVYDLCSKRKRLPLGDIIASLVELIDAGLPDHWPGDSPE